MDNKFKKSLKVNDIEKEQYRSVELLLKYIEKEKEINKAFDEEDGIDINASNYKPSAEVTIRRIMNLLAYREVRVKQAYVSKMNVGNNSRDIRAILAGLDKDRREKHNLALSSLKGLVEFAKKNNLEPIYTGNILSEKEIEEHKPSSYDVRQEMTDAFLKILKDLSDYSIRNFDVRENNKELKYIHNRLYEIEGDYSVKQELIKDDGDILFYDFEKDAELDICI